VKSQATLICHQVHFLLIYPKAALGFLLSEVSGNLDMPSSALLAHNHETTKQILDLKRPSQLEMKFRKSKLIDTLYESPKLLSDYNLDGN